MSKETTDTLGNQKRINYALRPEIDKEQFIQEVTEGLVAPPQYFPFNVLMNLKGGLGSIDDIIQRGTRGLPPKEFQMVWESEKAVVIDTRGKDEFPKAFIPGSIFIGLDDYFAPWVGALVIDLKQSILLITDEGREEEAVVRLARVGYDFTKGYLKGGLKAWMQEGFETDTLEEIGASDFESLYLKNPDIHLLDVRKESEFESQHLLGANNFPLDFINQNMYMLNKAKTYYVHCAGGYRSIITASILKARGYENVINILGGFRALSATSLAKSDFTTPKTML